MYDICQLPLLFVQISQDWRLFITGWYMKSTEKPPGGGFVVVVVEMEVLVVSVVVVVDDEPVIVVDVVVVVVVEGAPKHAAVSEHPPQVKRCSRNLTGPGPGTWLLSKRVPKRSDNTVETWWTSFLGR